MVVAARRQHNRAWHPAGVSELRCRKVELPAHVFVEENVGTGERPLRTRRAGAALQLSPFDDRGGVMYDGVIKGQTRKDGVEQPHVQVQLPQTHRKNCDATHVLL